MQDDLLAHIRNGQPLTFLQKIKLVVVLSVPSIMAQLTSIIMQYIDAFMVGRLGADATAAIGVVASTTWLLGGLCSSSIAGYSIQVAQFIGAKEYDKAKIVLRHSYMIVLGMALLLAIIGAAVSGPLPLWLGCEHTIAAAASSYFLVYALSLPAVALNRLAASMMQCAGNMKVPGILNSLMCGWDVILNAVFIYGLQMGVLGAAVGTALSELITAGFMCYFLWKRTPMLHTKGGGRLRWQPAYIKKATRISIPIALERCIMSGGLVMTTNIVAPLGTVAIAANSLAVTAESLCYMPGYGIADAATTLVGQSVGAGRKEMTRSFSRITVVFGMLFMTITGLLLFLLSPVLMAMLTPDAAVQQLGARVLRIEAFAEPLYAASIVVAGVLRGAGDTLACSLLSLVSLWCVRIPLSYIWVGPLKLLGIWIAMCTELCFRGMIFLGRLLRGKWIGKADALYDKEKNGEFS